MGVSVSMVPIHVPELPMSNTNYREEPLYLTNITRDMKISQSPIQDFR